jgi:hypothetical protein
MKLIIFLIACGVPLTLFCQETLKGPWKLECGATTNTGFKDQVCYNLRYISPRFKYTNDDWTEEMEKDPEKYKKARFMLELLYTPPLEVLCMGVNLQYRIIKFKRFSAEAYGGMKFIFIAPPDFIKKPELIPVVEKQGWYINVGLIFQLDLEFVLPFVDIGYDGLTTIGTAFNFHAIYKKPKRRYNLKVKTK